MISLLTYGYCPFYIVRECEIKLSDTPNEVKQILIFGLEINFDIIYNNLSLNYVDIIPFNLKGSSKLEKSIHIIS